METCPFWGMPGQAYLHFGEVSRRLLEPPMNRILRTEPQRLTKPAGLGLGERLRRLRVAAGLTQGELAGDRFSKEYVSQIERGKTRPTPETVEWLAKRPGGDPALLSPGGSAGDRGHERGRARSPPPCRRGLGADGGGRRPDGDRPAARSACARRGQHVHR